MGLFVPFVSDNLHVKNQTLKMDGEEDTKLHELSSNWFCAQYLDHFEKDVEV